MAMYDPEMQVDWQKLFLAQAAQSGHGSFFEGQLYQRGHGIGNFFRGIFKLLAPVAKTVGKAVGRQALSAAGNIAHDVVHGENIKTAVKRRGKQGLRNLAKKAHKNLKAKQHQTQRGKGLGTRKRSHKGQPTRAKTRKITVGVQKTKRSRKDIFGNG